MDIAVSLDPIIKQIAKGRYLCKELDKLIAKLHLDKYEVSDLQIAEQIVDKKLKVTLKNSNTWQQYNQLQYAIYRLIHNKPLDEQLRLMRENILEINALTRKLENRGAAYQATTNELSIEKCLINYLSQQYDDVSPLPLIDDAIISADGSRVVQWYSILQCEKDDTIVMYFIESRVIPHPNDVVAEATSCTDRRYLDLQCKAQRTEHFFKDLQYIDDSGRKLQFMNQNKLLRPFIDRKHVYVNATRGRTL